MRFLDQERLSGLSGTDCAWEGEEKRFREEEVLAWTVDGEECLIWQAIGVAQFLGSIAYKLFHFIVFPNDYKGYHALVVLLSTATIGLIDQILGLINLFLLSTPCR